MGNCAASKLGSWDDEEAVSLCRGRKRLLKAAVQRRNALADAQQRYIRSIHAVAGAINLFVALHSSPSSILITLPSSSPPSSSSDPPFLRQTPTEPKAEASPYRSSASYSTSLTPNLVVGGEGEGREMNCGYFFAEIPMAPPSPVEAYGWDFFNPFEGLRAADITGGLGRSSDEDLRAVREHEGIPDLEEEEVHEAKRELAPTTLAVEIKGKEEVVKVERSEGESAVVMEVPEKRMELLDALKDVEEEFVKAYESGKELARMLEANAISLRPEDEIKESSSKIIQAVTWRRSFSSFSSSSQSSLVLDPLIECRSELFDDYGGMGSGSHSQTLGRLYAWEKKLYEEVKAGEQTRQMFEKKCLQLRNHDTNGLHSHTVDKSRAVLKDLYARICVALRTIEKISCRIQKVLDDELHPQLIELLQGLVRTWKVMLDSHERQKQVMVTVKTFTCPSYGRYCSDSQRQVTRKLEEQFENWRSCFKNYVDAQRLYVEALDGWHSKFFVPDINYYSRTRSLAPSYRDGSYPLLLILREWMSSSKKFPDMAVSISMKGFINDIRVLYVKQGEEQQQKRKVDGLAKEFDQRSIALQKAENRILEYKLSDSKPEAEVRDRVEYLAGKKELVNTFRQKLEMEKAKHQNCMHDTMQVTLNGFRDGLGRVFESLAEFSRDCLNLYTELLTQFERAMIGGNLTREKRSCTEDLKVEVDIR